MFNDPPLRVTAPPLVATLTDMHPSPTGIKVLLVDDDVDMRLLARRGFEFDGRFQIVGEGADGGDAILLATREQPDVVLLDLEMPWLDGAEAVPHIRRALPDAIIAIWTVAPRSVRAREALSLGATIILDKSFFRAGELVDRVWELTQTVSSEPDSANLTSA